MKQPLNLSAEFAEDPGLKLEYNLLADSGLFDEAAYLKQVGHEARRDPIAHYLLRGWRLGAEPNSSFPGASLLSYLGDLGRDKSPAITWLTLRSAGWKLPKSRQELEELAAKITGSGLFDARYYLAQLGSTPAVFDPIIHYLLVGERIGLAPSREFNPSYYGARYPDVALDGTNYLIHFVEHGHAEGRFPLPVAVMRTGCANMDPAKENVILVVHETSRSGAPILGWNIAVYLAREYNIFAINLQDGELSPEFQHLSAEMYGPFPGSRRDPADIEYSLRPLLDVRKYRYAIINSAASYLFVEPCVRRLIPAILLVHEFGSYIGGGNPLAVALDSATEIVFPADLVKRAAESRFPNLIGRSTHVIPQGMAVQPRGDSKCGTYDVSTDLEKLIVKYTIDKRFIVVGIGPVELRKGVDLFLAAAASIFRRHADIPMHFLWVGSGYRPQEDLNYSAFLEEQVKRSGLREHVTFLDSVPDLEPLYRAAGALLLSSRLDPMPNITIDAAFRGIPIVCFRDASGMAELMLRNPYTAIGVVDYLDSEAAAIVLLKLAEDESFRERTALAMQTLARQHFDMEHYLARLDALGVQADQRMKQRQEDADTLCGDPTFDQDMFLGPAPVVETRDETIIRYLTKGAECSWETSPSLSYRRRPCPGFNPRIYAAAQGTRLAGTDALADFIRQGRPEGPWQVSVLRPDDPRKTVMPSAQLRVAIHAHFFYPDLCDEFLSHLIVNRSSADLIVTTDTSPKAAQLKEVLRSYFRGRVDVRVVPNKGRDIGPLLTELPNDLSTYDLIGHVHGKRSPYAGETSSSPFGDDWREFLWQNLIGGLHPMMDRIIAAFEQNRDLGLVFPSDPNICGWDENRDHAAELATRMGWMTALPDQFDFPVGTMFWIRLDALQPLLDLRLTWDDYPQEPLDRDGTLLHALERLLPLACRLAGFRHAVTHVFGVSWMPPI